MLSFRAASALALFAFLNTKLVTCRSPGESAADASPTRSETKDVNLTGVHHTVDVAMRPMIKAGNGGSIVLISSVMGLVGLGSPFPGSIGYAAAKHGVV